MIIHACNVVLSVSIATSVDDDSDGLVCGTISVYTNSSIANILHEHVHWLTECESHN